MIKKIYLSAVLIAVSSFVFGQIGKIKNIGKASDLAKSINNVSVPSPNNRAADNTFILAAPSGENMICTVNIKTIANGMQEIGGSAGKNGSFSLSVDALGTISGLYTSVKDRKAYKYYMDEANVNVLAKEVDIATVLCIDFKRVSTSADVPTLNENERGMMAIPKYDSKPGSAYVIYIDLDGETSKTSGWNSGNTITAAARSWTTANIQEMWEVVAQDYFPWDVNVTTDRAVFDAADPCKRKMCIVTSTDAAAPGAGGVAHIGSFDNCKDDPCWVFNAGAKVAGETVSHEVGHTVGLNHDGVSGGSAYYSGHNNWAPIMGSAYNTSNDAAVYGQWSKGEYNNANNTSEDDITIIGTQNGFGQKPDDAGNTTAAAATLVVETNGSVLNTSNKGLINNRTDLDVYKFTTGTAGDVSLTVSPYFKGPDITKHPDLNVKLRLLNSGGTAIATADPTGTAYTNMSATVTASGLAAGTYYLEIDGVGDGANAGVGYSDYASIGAYYISGTVPLPTNKPVPQFASSSSKFCAGTQVTYTDQTVGATSWKWTFPGGTPASSTAQNPTVTYNSSGTYDVKLVAQNTNGKDSLTKANYITVLATPADPSTTGDSRCSAGVVNLSAAGSGTLEWYTASTGGSPITTGTTYAPNISTTTTYYVSATNAPAPQKVGPVDNTLNTGGYFTTNDTRGLLFDVLGTCTLKTVKVFANTAGNRTIEVRQGVGGAVLNTKTVNIPAGESRVTLDFVLQPGTQYHIKVTGTLVDLYRNSGGASYPYTLAGLVSITETDAAPTSPNYYYYFYDWEVAAPGCTSNRVLVTGTIKTTPATPTITQNGLVLTSSSATGNQWYLNGNIIPGATGQTYTVTQNGNYTVVVTVNGCSSAASAPTNIINTGITQTDNAYFFSIYPNPNDGNFKVSFSTDAKANYKLELRNTLGQLIYNETLTDFTGSYMKQLNVAEFGKGIYMISLTNDKSETVKKVIVY